MTVIVASAMAGNVPVPPRKEQPEQDQMQIHMKPAGTRCVQYPPPRGVKTTGVERNGRAIRKCQNSTKAWVTHADIYYLEMATNKGNLKEGWKSYFM